MGKKSPAFCMEPGHVKGHKKCPEIQPCEVAVASLCYISEQALSF